LLRISCQLNALGYNIWNKDVYRLPRRKGAWFHGLSSTMAEPRRWHMRRSSSSCAGWPKLGHQARLGKGDTSMPKFLESIEGWSMLERCSNMRRWACSYKNRTELNSGELMQWGADVVFDLFHRGRSNARAFIARGRDGFVLWYVRKPIKSSSVKKTTS
jgi:hypothetical protein